MAPHQPIYGIRTPGIRKGFPQSYVILYNLLKVLDGLDFNSLLDVGGREGYTAYRIRRAFNAKVEVCDMHIDQIYKEVNYVVGDATRLQYKDNSFDIVLCTEALEHIEDFRRALKELKRVAKKYVLITVPFREKLAHSQKMGSSHKHRFDYNTIDADYKITFASSLTRRLAKLGRYNTRWVAFCVWLDRFLKIRQNTILYLIKVTPKITTRWVVETL